MKRLSLWLAVGFVLFSFQGGFSRPTQSQLDSLEKPYPPVVPSTNYIYYDSVDVDSIGGEPVWGATNYWMAEKFTPDSAAFTLKVLYYQVDNSRINTTDDCIIKVAKDLDGSSPDTTESGILFQDTISAPLQSVLRSIQLPTPLPFNKNEEFWILLGPVPGGGNPDTASDGDGWWGFVGRTAYKARSYLRFDGGSLWNALTQYNWVLRAGGDWSPPPQVVINEVMFNADNISLDPARNHEWVELYNPVAVHTTEGWQLTNGQGPAPLVPKSFNLPTVRFDSGAFLVIHFATGNNDTDLSDGRGDIYTNDAMEFFNDRKDACALRVPPELLSSEFVDIVAWNLKNLSTDSDSSGKTSREVGTFNDSNKVIRVKPNNGIGPLLTATQGISIGRDKSGSNPTTSTRRNLSFVGGPDAAGPTIGQSNELPMVFNSSGILPPPVGTADWTLMLYMAADYGDNLISPDKWYYDLLNQIERYVPTGADSVNVVVLLDTRRARLAGDSDTLPNSVTFEGALRQDTTPIVYNLAFVSTSRNTGIDTTLSGFILRAKSNYPANHYALAIKGDGAGWQGVCGDASAGDRLEIGELKSALTLAGLDVAKLDLLIFDAPLMSQLEVAAQVKDFAHIMVASPEMTGPADLDYSRLVRALKGGPSLPALVDTLGERTLDSLLRQRVEEDPFAVWAAIDLDSLNTLLQLVDTLAINLKNGVEDRCRIGVSDNYQIKIRSALRNLTADHYGTQAQGMADFVDLRRLAIFLDQITEDFCELGHDSCANRIANRLVKKGPVIFALEGGGLSTVVSNPGIHRLNPAGLSIYFPSARQRATPFLGKLFKAYSDKSDHPFDGTGCEWEGGISQGRRVYAADSTACYPHTAGVCDTGTTNDTARNYPFPPSANFDFVQYYGWDEFLIRYYKPVADVESTFYIKNVNQSFFLKGTGTSDPDSDSLTYIWDLAHNADSDYPCDSFALEDVDKNCVDDSTDDGNLQGGQDISFSGFQIAGDHILWLHVWDDYHLYSNSPRFQTDRIMDSLIIQIEFEGVKLAYEDDTVDEIYRNTLAALDPPPSVDLVDLRQQVARTNMPANRLTQSYQGFPHVLWTTGNVTTESMFPNACQTALNNALANDSQAVWICAPFVGLNDVAKNYFKTTWGFDAVATIDTTSYLVPYPGSQHFLSNLDTLPLTPGTSLELLNSLNCPSYPLLINSSGDVVAAARVLTGGQRGIVFSTFGLEHIPDDNRKKDLLTRVLSWMSLPTPSSSCSTCPAEKGDMDGVGGLTPSDAVLMLNCVFAGNGTGTVGGDCNLCYSDVDCSGDLSPSDTVLELLRVFGGQPFPCL